MDFPSICGFFWCIHSSRNITYQFGTQTWRLVFQSYNWGSILFQPLPSISSWLKHLLDIRYCQIFIKILQNFEGKISTQALHLPSYMRVWLCVGRSDISFSVSCRRLVGFFKTALCFCELDALPWRHLAKFESNHPILSYRGSKWSCVWAVAAEVPPKHSHFTPLKSFTHTNSAQQLRLFFLGSSALFGDSHVMYLGNEFQTWNYKHWEASPCHDCFWDFGKFWSKYCTQMHDRSLVSWLALPSHLSLIGSLIQILI